MQQRRAIVSVQMVFKACFIIAAQSQRPLLYPSDCVVRIRNDLARAQRRRLRTVVRVVGIGGVPLVRSDTCHKPLFSYFSYVCFYASVPVTSPTFSTVSTRYTVFNKVYT